MYRSVSKHPHLLLICVGLVIATSTICIAAAKQDNATDRPNVVFIICDDLNDYIEGFGGHPQTITPNMERLADSGVRFTQAHCNIPICGPSRACLFSGIYPQLGLLWIYKMGYL